jgi:hypothetical protein
MTKGQGTSIVENGGHLLLIWARGGGYGRSFLPCSPKENKIFVLGFKRAFYKKRIKNLIIYQEES